MMYFNDKGELVFDDETSEPITEEEKEKQLKYDLFRDILKNILESNTLLEWQIVKKTYSPFIINRCLANNKKFRYLAMTLNRYASQIPPELHYTLLHKIIQPKRKRYLKYFKESKSSANIKLMAEFFGVSTNEIYELTAFISQKEITHLIKQIKTFEKDKITRRQGDK